MKFSKFLLILILSTLQCTIFAQDCELHLTGQLFDEQNNEPLPLSIIYFEELKTGVSANSLGEFSMANLCAGEYHLRITCLGYESVRYFIEIHSDTFLSIGLHSHILQTVVIHTDKSTQSTQNAAVIDKDEISRDANKSLGDILENVGGVTTLKTGTGISKPVIQGLSGNRVTIINNGLAQAGQQWGNDHAPEIDPFSASKITVIKGASSLAYPGNSLGGVVVIEATTIEFEPHIHGQANYIFQTNGRGHTGNLLLEKFGKSVAWRTGGTLKWIGDYKSPNYFLTNTGHREADYFLQLEKQITPNLFLRTYYSYFHSEQGILRGSQIGNVNDFELAIGRDVPFFTSVQFSYQLQAPRQKVDHHLVKTEANWHRNPKKWLKLKYGFQANSRKEFDVRRSGRTNIPTLFLLQQTHYVGLIYDWKISQALTLKSGLQSNSVFNRNNPATGIYPLIPDYNGFTNSGFLIANRKAKKGMSEAGIRFDRKDLFASAFTRTYPVDIVRYNRHFNNLSALLGHHFQYAENAMLKLNLGYSFRAPEVNELYSYGLHQGVSGIEIGKTNLRPEKSLKWSATWQAAYHKKLTFEATAFAQTFADYIYLQVLPDPLLTIRGSFPVYEYRQTQAFLYGVDAALSYEFNQKLKLNARYSFTRGQDLTNNIALVYIPPAQANASVHYALKDGKKFHNNTLSINGIYTAKQTHPADFQDILAAPPAWYLLGFNASSTLHFTHSNLTFGLQGENILNRSYRNYLNRQRYFADEIGINISFKMNYRF